MFARELCAPGSFLFDKEVRSWLKYKRSAVLRPITQKDA